MGSGPRFTLAPSRTLKPKSNGAAGSAGKGAIQFVTLVMLRFAVLRDMVRFHHLPRSDYRGFVGSTEGRREARWEEQHSFFDGRSVEIIE